MTEGLASRHQLALGMNGPLALQQRDGKDLERCYPGSM